MAGTFQLVVFPCLLGRGALRAHLEAVHVAAETRGQGIGAAMVRHAVAEARAAGAASLELTANKVRGDAHRFYRRLGFAGSHEGFRMAL